MVNKAVELNTGEIIIIENNQAVTSSLQVAKDFGKEHKHVIESIKNLTVENMAVKNMFYESTYVNSRGRTYPQFYMNRDGFSILAMGFTGNKALDFKIKYINRFNEMEEQLKSQVALHSYMITDPIERAKKWIEEEESRKLLSDKIEEQKPLVNFAEKCIKTNDSVLVRELAKVITDEGYVIGEKKLYAKLREWGLILKGKTEPSQKAMDKGYFEVIQKPVSTPYGEKLTRTTMVKPKGQVYIVERILNELK